MHFPDPTVFAEKLIMPNLLTAETQSRFWQIKVAYGKLAAD